MTLTSVLYMLLGAALVAIGVVASALADRIRSSRGLARAAREPVARNVRRGLQQVAEPREISRKTPSAIPVIGPAELLRPARVKPTRARSEPKSASGGLAGTPEGAHVIDGGDDVISALVEAGYKRSLATEATWACGVGERATIEGWTAAALRRCARGGLS